MSPKFFSAALSSNTAARPCISPIIVVWPKPLRQPIKGFLCSPRRRYRNLQICGGLES